MEAVSDTGPTPTAAAVKAGTDVAVGTAQAMVDVRAFLLPEGRPDDAALVRFWGRFGADVFTVAVVVSARGEGTELTVEGWGK